ncbi:uncharacterized protein BJX67DRAFT_364466 [Aspergillus lucknowensis]|uniref:Uncharacterized protein n=1 Tax=Aspergillus lucknowensis TaxID=176173 RepID=A0ABR4LF99_9EURO
MLSVCAGLVTIDEASRVIRLVHCRLASLRAATVDLMPSLRTAYSLIGFSLTPHKIGDTMLACRQLKGTD